MTEIQDSGYLLCCSVNRPPPSTPINPALQWWHASADTDHHSPSKGYLAALDSAQAPRILTCDIPRNLRDFPPSNILAQEHLLAIRRWRAKQPEKPEQIAVGDPRAPRLKQQVGVSCRFIQGWSLIAGYAWHVSPHTRGCSHDSWIWSDEECLVTKGTEREIRASALQAKGTPRGAMMALGEHFALAPPPCHQCSVAQLTRFQGTRP